MPARLREDQCWLLFIERQGIAFGENLLNRGGFLFLPLSIEPLQLLRQFPRPRFVRGYEQFNYLSGTRHSTRRVDTRRQPEGHLVCRREITPGESGNLQQRS